jgi:hypothetical protein
MNQESVVVWSQLVFNNVKEVHVCQWVVLLAATRLAFRDVIHSWFWNDKFLSFFQILYYI